VICFRFQGTTGKAKMILLGAALLTNGGMRRVGKFGAHEVSAWELMITCVMATTE